MPLWPQVSVGSASVVDATAHVGYPEPATLAEIRAVLGSTCLDLGPATLTDHPHLTSMFQPTILGPGATVRAGAVLYEGTEAGDRLDVAHCVVVREGTRLGSDCYLKCQTDIRRDVTVGSRCTIAGLVGDRAWISDDVTMLGSLVHTSAGAHRGAIEPAPRLEQGVFVGRGAVVVGNVTLGASAYIGAGAIVRRDVRPGERVL